MSIHLATLGGLKVFRNGEELAALPGQPVRTALLVYVSVTGSVTRDRLLELLWPEKDLTKARSALSSTLHELGRSLQDDWRESHGDVLRATQVVSVDAVQFAAAAERGDDEEAIALYGGPFLDGIHLVETRGFEGWVDQFRSYLARLHRECRSKLVGDRIDAGDLHGALTAAHEWTELEPLEDEAHHRCIELLARTGRPAEAIRLFGRFRERLYEELELEPMEEMVTLVERIRSGEVAPRRALSTIPAGVEVGSADDEPVGAASTPGAAGPASPQETRGGSLVVLPFMNMSPDPENQYFSDGMTEELITSLARLDGLRVAASTSSFALKGTTQDVREIRSFLGVDWVVEGSVRKSGEELRISSRLVDAENGYELWCGTWDRRLEDVFAIQDEIAWAITDSLAPHLGQQRRSAGRRQTGSPEAYDLYLVGRHFYNSRTPDGLAKAIHYFRKALKRDPEYALAYSGLADAFIAQAHFQYRPPLEVMPDAEAATRWALEIDSGLAEAQCSKAHIEDTFNWRWQEAERGYRRAIELDPTYAHARITYADLLTALGRHDESRGQAERAEGLEPLSVPIKFQKGTQLYRARRYDEALPVLERALDMDPTYFPARTFHALALVAMGRAGEAVAHIERSLEQFGKHPTLLVVRGYGLAVIGDHAQARSTLRMLEEAGRRRYVPSLLRAVLHGALGDVDLAFEALDQALEERYAQLTFLAVDPSYDPLARDPRFAEVIETLGLRRESRAAPPLIP